LPPSVWPCDGDAADLQQEVDFLLREVIGQLVLGDAVFIEAAGFFLGFEDHHVVAQHGQAVRARQACRAGADHGDFLAGAGGALEWMLFELHVDRWRSAAAGRSSRAGLPHRDCARSVLAQDFGRTDARAAAAEDVLLQDAGGGAVDVFVVDIADESSPHRSPMGRCVHGAS
jgi:hypothetical protein